MYSYWLVRTCEGSSKAQAADVSTQLQSFRVWQAKQLVRRDLAACVFMLFVSFLYMYKTLPEVCSRGLACSTRERYQVDRHHDDSPRSPLWLTVCGKSLSAKGQAFFQAGAGAADAAFHPRNWLTHVAAAVSQPRALLAAVTQAGMSFLNVGRLSRDPLHLVFPPLCIIPLLLLLLPHPHINPAAIWRRAAAALRSHHRASEHTDGTKSEPYTLIIWYLPCYYWQQPLLRTTVVVLQRLLVYLAAASCVGRSDCQYLLLVQGAKYWGAVGKFAYLGWVAYILMLPMPLHIPVSCFEWLIGYRTMLRINALAHHSSSSSSDHVILFLQRYRLPISMLLAIVLPTLAVMGLEKAQRKLYNKVRQKAQLHSKSEGPSSGSSSSKQGPGQQQRDDDPLYDAGTNTTALQLDRAGSLSPMQGLPAAAAAGGAGRRASGSSRRSSSSRRMSNIRRSVDPIGPQFLADMTCSLQLAANHTAVPYVSTVGGTTTPAAAAAAVPRVLLPSAAAAAPDESGTPRRLSGLGSPVPSPLAEEAAEVFAAAAAGCRSP